MAGSASIRFLLLWTIVCTFCKTPQIQAQSTNTAGLLVTPSIASNASYSPQFSSSDYLVTPSSAFQTFPNASDSLANKSTIQVKSSPAVITERHSTTTSTTQLTGGTISPTKSQTASSSVRITTGTIPATTATETEKEADENILGITEYILIACLVVFFCVFIAVIFLVVQMMRLNTSVNNLKATSRR